MIKKFWEDFYEKRGRFYLTPHQYISKLSNNFKKRNVKKVLDIGCGSGRHSIFLAKEGFSVTGIDFSPKALQLAGKWASLEEVNVKFIKQNITKKLSFKNETYDACICIDSIHYSSTDEMNKILAESHRILSKNGTIFITLPQNGKNKYISHLVFSSDTAKELITKFFSINEEFIDDEGFLCFLAEKKELSTRD